MDDNDYTTTITDDALEALRSGLMEPVTHETLVRRACEDNEVLEWVRKGNKVKAIVRLHQLGAFGLREAKEAIEDPRIEESSKAPWVYVLGDCEGERIEIYLVEQDALDRMEEINQRMGQGYAYYDTIKTFGLGQRPAHPHNGI